MKLVCLTNDDGPYSIGLQKLAEKISERQNLVVVTPNAQRSATGKSLTLNRPLRVLENHEINGYRLITHDGTPADSVVLADSMLEEIELFVSGINAGGNLGYQSLLTSGTVGAAMEAALKGYPALAVSMEAGADDWFNPNGPRRSYEIVCDLTMTVINKILNKGLPLGIDLLNLNFPCETNRDTVIEITRPSRVRMRNEVEERIDPHGRTYYWFRGVEVAGKEGLDVHTVLEKNKASLSPIVLDCISEKHMQDLKSFMS
ncbi:5'/3'-nucleotidase SurE [Candidatus Thorarchaeota archaeon]|nr:MAG: 5'/3'-nucleotidase SurE [Candidatus Thorarchaeota archaeon]